MGRQIIKQPNGKYAVWSSICDDLIYIDCEPKDIIKFFIEDEAEKIADSVNTIINKIEKGEKPYFQFTRTWGSILGEIKEQHGHGYYDRIVKQIGDMGNDKT